MSEEAQKPILILQLQRLGDLVLTYPLLGWLNGVFPGRPLWVVGEERFYSGLMSLSPAATYFPYSEAVRLRPGRYSLVLNLSPRPEAAALAGGLNSEALLGPYLAKDGATYIRGNWQLYRASLTSNNRHNLFHWADLNALDVIPGHSILRTAWPGIQSAYKSGAPARIGLFLGASAPEKRPDAEFWSQLARIFLRQGHKPVLLGGPGETDLGRETAQKAGATAIDLCGRFSVTELVDFIRRLDLFISPDTGPMHVAVWAGAPTLNLSLGPVNPWETGPFAPGHHVLRSNISCVGCWECAQKSIICKERFNPARAARAANAILDGGPPGRLPGQELLQSARDKYGLFDLESLGGGKPGRLAAARFWQKYFGYVFGFMPEQDFKDAALALNDHSPALARLMRRKLPALAHSLSAAALGKPTHDLHSLDYWLNFPPILRPLSSYLQLHLQNSKFSRQGLLEGCGLLERLLK